QHPDGLRGGVPVRVIRPYPSTGPDLWQIKHNIANAGLLRMVPIDVQDIYSSSKKMRTILGMSAQDYAPVLDPGPPDGLHAPGMNRVQIYIVRPPVLVGGGQVSFQGVGFSPRVDSIGASGAVF